MTTFVLVPGFWLGGWAWQEVADDLRGRGHEVHAVTLTGMGDQPRPDATLYTHIADVVTLLDTEDLHEVVLVGHSYGGVVVTGAADRAAHRLARIVYVDSGPLLDGMTHQDFDSPEDAERDAARVRDGFLPPPSFDELAEPLRVGLDPEGWAAVLRRAQGQPVGTYTTPLRLTGAARNLPRTAILCSFPLAVMRQLAEVSPVFAGMVGPEWTHHELPTGHWPMFSRPLDLAASLSATPAG